MHNKDYGLNEKDKAIFTSIIKKMRSYHPSQNFDLVEKAYKLAKNAHKEQFRKNGEPYIMHPLEVAYILADLKLDRETITAGILHDVIEDTQYDYDYIKANFSEEIANLVDGVTKLEKLHQKQKGLSPEERQVENYRKMFLAMADDIRVILVKIADRLHNLRTLEHMPPEKQKRIAQESLDIYAPLAGRLGISVLRREMEDISFRYSNNESYYSLKERINTKLGERMKYVDQIVATIDATLKKYDIIGTVEGRPKHFFSIYKKMKNSGKTLDQIFDLFAVRVIVETLDQCYAVLGAVHSIFKPIPERFKDYISAPKGNGYQSLHNSLIGPNGIPFEIQIRTIEMHKTAEYGIAAHWKYKEGKKELQESQANDSDEHINLKLLSAAAESKTEEKLTWLRQILEWQRETPDNHEFLDTLKGDLDVYAEFVHVFTPAGKVIVLMKGSTCIDFAYAIHSAVGNKMTGARVNNKIEKKEYVLKNGDQIEILTSQNSKGPSSEWLKLVKTSQAKNKIKQWLKKEDKEESTVKGKELLEKSAKRKGMALAQLLTPESEKSLLNRFAIKDFDTLCASVGRGAIKENSVVNRLYEEYIAQNPKDPLDILSEINKKARQNTKNNTSDVIVKGEHNLSIRFSKCCGPVPGDEIIGFITRGRGVTIHRTDCINILNLNENEVKRLAEAQWNVSDIKEHIFYVEINILCENMNLITPITQVFRKSSIEIRALSARPLTGSANSLSSETIINVAFYVADREDLDMISLKLMSIKGVVNVDRIMH